MSAGQFNFEIEQGATFTTYLTIKDSNGVGIDQTGNTFAGQVRERYDSSTLLGSFTITLENQGTDPGKIKIVLPAATSAAFPALAPEEECDCSEPPPPRRLSYFEYDIERTNVDSTKDRILEGQVIMSPEVTK